MNHGGHPGLRPRIPGEHMNQPNTQIYADDLSTYPVPDKQNLPELDADWLKLETFNDPAINIIQPSEVLNFIEYPNGGQVDIVQNIHGLYQVVGTPWVFKHMMQAIWYGGFMRGAYDL